MKNVLMSKDYYDRLVNSRADYTAPPYFLHISLRIFGIINKCVLLVVSNEMSWVLKWFKILKDERQIFSGAIAGHSGIIRLYSLVIRKSAPTSFILWMSCAKF